MRARGALLPLLVLTGIASAGGEPKPTAVDIKPFRDQLLVLEDAQGGTYVVLPGSDSRVWYGASGKNVYEQVVVTRGSNGETGGWSFGVWAPRLSGLTPATIQRRDDGAYERFCDDKQAPLKVVPADRAKLLIGKLSFLTTGITRRAHLFARDDAAVYYYVDVIAKQYGGGGYRVFVGKKGAMKQLPLSDVATDSAGEVYSTKSGDVRFVIDATDPKKNAAYWVKGEKKNPLFLLDTDVNSHVIWADLGIYQFIGTPCDEF
jgi:hypothetical protein